MKTKLELYLAVQKCAEETLDAKPAVAHKALDELLKPLSLAPADVDFATQLFHSRRQRMEQLREEPLTAVEKTEPAKPAAKPSK